MPAVINPEKILGPQKGNIKAFQNFMTGGAGTLGANILKSASNNIVGFNRANVSAAPPEINSVISNISTNILNTVNESVNGLVSGIQTRLQDEFNSIVTRFSTDYQNKLKSTEDNAPRNILGNFLKLYKDAIGFITFFGNSKNIDRISKSLKSLRIIFNDSFEIAKIIRQTIQKIVKQLTNLPTASGGRGGLNIDVDVPGGPLKRSGGSRLSRFLNVGGKVALAAGGVATAGFGISAAAQYQKEKLAESKVSGDNQYSILEEVADIFSKAVNKFTNVIQSLFSGNKNKNKSKASAGGGSSPSNTPPPATSGDGSAVLPQQGTPEEYRIAAALATEGGSGVNATDILQVAANRIASGKYGKSFTDVFAAPGQFHGVFSRGIENYRNIKTKEDAARFAGLSISEIDSRLAAMRNQSYIQDSASTVKGALEFRAAPGYYLNNGLVKGMDSSGRFSNSVWRGNSGANQYLIGPGDPQISGPAQIILPSGNTPPQSTTEPPKPEESPTKIQPRLVTSGTEPGKGGVISTGATASIVAAKPITPTPPSPPPSPTESNSNVNVITLPDPKPIIDSTTSQNSGGGNNVNVPSAPSPGPGVPFLSPSNPDNFYIHLSALTLNLVNR